MREIVAAVLAVLVLGTVGYAVIGNMSLVDAVFSTVSVVATVNTPEGLSDSGKLFTAALLIVSIGVWITAVVRFLNPPVEGEDVLTGFFAPEQEGFIMKEIRIGSSLAGMRKAQILQQHGVIVVGVKKKSGFDIDAPATMRVKKGSSVLVMGAPAAIIGLEKKR